MAGVGGAFLLGDLALGTSVSETDHARSTSSTSRSRGVGGRAGSDFVAVAAAAMAVPRGVSKRSGASFSLKGRRSKRALPLLLLPLLVPPPLG